MEKLRCVAKCRYDSDSQKSQTRTESDCPYVSVRVEGMHGVRGLRQLPYCFRVFPNCMVLCCASQLMFSV
jgi:hypothetical protein